MHFFHVGGSLPQDALCYVARQADQDLLNGVRSGNFCYVLNSRQMGKSSLRVQAMKQLQHEGIRCAEVDVTLIGTKQVTPGQWFGGVIQRLITELDLESDLSFSAWIRERRDLSHIQILSEFLEKELLTRIPEPIAIFIDEIDSLLALEFKDDFFAFIRACYNQRADNPEFKRLTFIFLGVATPSNLIDEPSRTPFNIGKAIELSGFQLHEVTPLTQGFVGIAAQPNLVMQFILEWTGGQPFLTQKVCTLIQEHYQWIDSGQEKTMVDTIVHDHILHQWESYDEPEHLRTIQKRFLGDETYTIRWLEIYRHILTTGSFPFNGTHEQRGLRLTGLVVKTRNTLQVYNRIYAAIFNQSWIEMQLAKICPYAQSLNNWLDAGKPPSSPLLLSGADLQDAQRWAAGKMLSANDYDFLQASIKEEARAIIATAEEQAQDAKEQVVLAKRRVRYLGSIGIGILILTGFLTASFLVTTNRLERARSQVREAQAEVERAEDEQQSLSAINTSLEAGNESLEADNVNLEAHLDTLQADMRTVEVERGQAQDGLEQMQTELAEIQNRLNDAEREVATERDNAQLASQETRQAQQAADEARSRQAEIEDQYQQTANSLQNAEADLAETRAEQGNLQAINELERASNSVQQTFEFRQTEALLAATRAVAQMNELGSSSLEDYPTVSPLRSLQWAVDHIREIRLEGHEGDVRDVAFHPNDDFLVTVSEDNTAILWNLDGRQIKQLEGHEAPINDVEFHPNGTHILTASEDGTARLWNIDSNTSTVFLGHEGSVRDSTFHPNGDRIATSGEDGTVRLWTLSGQQLASLEDHEAAVSSVQFSATGNRILTISNDSTAILWDADGQFIKSFKEDGDDERITNATFSPTSDRMVTTSSQGIIQLWDLDGNYLQTFEDEESGIGYVTFNPSGDSIAVVRWNGTAQIYDLQGNLRENLHADYQEGILHLSFSPTGDRIAIGNQNGTTQIWNRSESILRTFEGHIEGIRKVAFSPTGNYITTVSWDGTARIWRLQGHEHLMFHRSESSFMEVAMSSVQNIVATSHPDGAVQLWDFDGNVLAPLEGHSEPVNRLTFSNSGDLLATASTVGTTRIWNVNGNIVDIFDVDEQGVWRLEFAPTDLYLAIIGRSGHSFYLWDIVDRDLHEIEGHENWVNDITFNPEGNLVATASGDRTAKIWDTEGTLITTLEGHEEAVVDIAFHPTGDLIATASWDGTARLWDLDGNELMQFSGHQGGVNQVVFSPSGHQLATGSQDRTARLWNLDGEELAILRGHGRRIWRIDFSPTGDRLATSGADYTVRIWDIEGDNIGDQIAQYEGWLRGFDQDWSHIFVLQSNDGLMNGVLNRRVLTMWTLEDAEGLLERACTYLESYLLQSDQVSESDRAMCGLSAQNNE